MSDLRQQLELCSGRRPWWPLGGERAITRRPPQGAAATVKRHPAMPYCLL